MGRERGREEGREGGRDIPTFINTDIHSLAHSQSFWFAQTHCRKRTHSSKRTHSGLLRLIHTQDTPLNSHLDTRTHTSFAHTHTCADTPRLPLERPCRSPS